MSFKHVFGCRNVFYARLCNEDAMFWQVLDLPEGKVKFSHELRFISESAEERECCYRVLDENGKQILPSSYVEVLDLFPFAIGISFNLFYEYKYNRETL